MIIKSNTARRLAGDTIVEVMISLLVISSILAGAFLVTRTSQKDVRSSQEHNIAVNLLQGQMENLREAAVDPDNESALTSSGSFCFASGAIQTAPSAACKKQQLYDISIKNMGQDDNGNYTFRGQANWDRVGGGGRNNVTLLYRLSIAGS